MVDRFKSSLPGPRSGSALVPPFVAVMLSHHQRSLYLFATVKTLWATVCGSGDAFIVALIATISTFFCRPFVAYILVKGLQFGLKGAWYALF